MYNLIKTEQQYEQYLELLGEVFNAKPNTKDGDKAELLTLLITNYEKKHYPEIKDTASPIDHIKIRMEDLDLKAVDLVERGIFTTKSNASMVLNKKRFLTLDMIRKLSDLLTLPIELLAKEYKLETNKAEALAA